MNARDGEQTLNHPEADDLDARIVERLRENPQVTSTELARDFKVVSATIGSRIRRMHDEGIARVVAMTPLHAIGYEVVIMAFVRLESAYALSLENVAGKFSRIPEVVGVSSLLSQEQLLLWISAKNLSHAEEVFEKKLGQVRGIVDVRFELVTQIVGGSGNLFTPVVLQEEQLFLDPLAEMLNDTEKSVLAELRLNGRQSIREVARRVTRSERTVRSAIKSMTERGLLELRTLVFMPAFGLTQCFIVEVDVDYHLRSKVVSGLLTLPEVSSVLTTTAKSHRLKVVIFIDSKGALASLLNQQIAAIPGVMDSRIIPVVSGLKHNSHVLSQ